MKDYIRDRLFRHGFLPSDEVWYKEDNNNINIASFNTNVDVGSGTEATLTSHVSGDLDANTSGVINNAAAGESQRRLSATRSLSRSNSFNRSLSNVSNRGSISVDGRSSDGEKKAGKRLVCRFSGFAVYSVDNARIGHSCLPIHYSHCSHLYREKKPSPLTLNTVAVHLRRLCLYLERKHSPTFREVSRPLNITMSSLVRTLGSRGLVTPNSW